MTQKPADRSNVRTAGASAPADHRAAAHPIMFWVLTGLALSVFTPCVLVPLWADTQQFHEYEQALELRTASLRKQLERDRARAEALVADPLVNERIVRRELGRRSADEQVLQWSSNEMMDAQLRLPGELLVASTAEPAATGDSISREHGVLMNWASAIAEWLPDWPWRDLFATSPNRPLLLAMSGGLLLAAFLLYGPRSRARV